VIFFSLVLLFLGVESATVPPGEIAFMLKGRVWLVGADGKNLRALTSELRYQADRPLAWSPDGAKLLYWSHSEVGWDIWVMDAGGHNQKNLTHTRSGGCRSPSWSPDGKRIAFMRDQPAGLYVMDADGRNQKRLSEKGHRDEVPAWSPDGQRIAFTDLRPVGANKVALSISVVDREGRDETQIVESGSNPLWSPDGKTILFVGRGRRSADLCSVDLGSKKQINLTNGPDYTSNPVPAPGGSRIAYLARNRTGGQHLRVMDAEGKDTRQLAEIEGDARYNITWSPDGKWLAFVSGTQGKEAIHVVSATGGGLRKIVDGRAVGLAWRPAQP
jgi:TolB protein